MSFISTKLVPIAGSLRGKDRNLWRDALTGARFCKRPVDLPDGSRYYVAKEPGRIHVTKFHGKTLTYERHCFRQQEEVDAAIARFTAACHRSLDATRSDSLCVDQILVSSFGFHHTTVEFYIVVSIHNRMVSLRCLAQDRVQNDGGLSGFATPRTGEFIGETFTRRVSPRSRVKISTLEHANPWDGTHVFCSVAG